MEVVEIFLFLSQFYLSPYFFCEIVFIPGVSKGGGAQHGGEVRCGNSIQQTTSMLLSVSLCKVEKEYEEVLHVEKLLV